MSNDLIALSLETRDVVGKKVKHLRREGKLPAVIHDHGKPSLHVMVPYMEMVKIWNKAGKHHPLELTIGNIKHMALIKDVDIEPKKYQIRHVVFNAIKQNEKVEAVIPIVLEGDAPAERTGLIVLKQLDEVEVKAFPRDLPDELKVDVTGLNEVGDSVTVADLQVPPNVEILVEPEHPIATVDEPRAHAEAEDEAAEAAVAGEVPSDHGSADATENAEAEKK